MLKSVKSKSRSVISINVSSYEKKSGLNVKPSVIVLLPGVNEVGDRELTEDNWKKAVQLDSVKARIDRGILKPLYTGKS